MSTEEHRSSSGPGLPLAEPSQELLPLPVASHCRQFQRVQPLLRRLVPRPLPCVEVRPTWNLELLNLAQQLRLLPHQRDDIPRPYSQSHCLCLLSTTLGTWPLWPLLQVVNPREGHPTYQKLACPGLVLWEEGAGLPSSNGGG